MQDARISKFAITSLVTGMLLFVPLVSGILASAFGVLALKKINNANGLLLGKGIAIGGLVLGALNILGWSAVFFGNTVYVIAPTQEAVVFRDKHLSRTLGPGVHLVYPGMDRVFVYDLYEVHSGNTGVQKYITNNKEQFEMNVEFDWRICAPAEYANSFWVGPDPELTKKALGDLVRNAIRQALSESQIDEAGAVGSESAYVVFRSSVDKNARAVGVCLAEDQRGEHKALRFSAQVP